MFVSAKRRQQTSYYILCWLIADNGRHSAALKGGLLTAMRIWIVSLVILTGTLLCHAVTEWTAGKFPNPQQDPERCGRPRRSFLCDPDHILSRENASNLDALLEGVFKKTKAPCAYQSYRITIALVRMIKDTARPVNTSLPMNEIQARQMLNKLRRSRAFAAAVREAWQHDMCGEDVLIVFSVREDVIYTTHGAAARKKLTPNVVYEISERAHSLFRDGDIFHGLKKMITDYGAVFNDSYVAVPMVTFSPFIDYVIGPTCTGHASRVTLTTSLTIVIAVVTFVT